MTGARGTGVGSDVVDDAGEIERWLQDAELAVAEEESLRRANSMANAALVSASMKAKQIQAAAQRMMEDAEAEADALLIEARTKAQGMLRDARAEVESILSEARAEAERVEGEALGQAKVNASRITDRALDQRDLLLMATLERVNELGAGLMDMAEQMVGRTKDDPSIREGFAPFMNVLSEAAGQVKAESALPPDLDEFVRRHSAGL